MAKKTELVKVPLQPSMLPEDEQLPTDEQPPDDGGYHETEIGKRSMDNATMKLVNYAYNTPRTRMAEMTILPRRLVTKLAAQVAKEAAINSKRNPITQPISEIFRYSLYQLLRSVGGFHLARAGIIAQAQLTSAEESDESEVRNG